jgi:hypothetical protein
LNGLDALKSLQSEVKLSANHRYYHEGKPLPGVTTICKVLDAPALTAWKIRMQVAGTAKAAFANPPAPG